MEMHMFVQAGAEAVCESDCADSFRCWCSTTADLFLGFVAELAKTVTKTLVILIDNASIHRARAIQPALRLLEKKGIMLKFLPPCSPELNRIEKLWWLIKHRWMALTRRTKVDLEQTVNHILTNFGSQSKMAF
jgi:transposase